MKDYMYLVESFEMYKRKPFLMSSLLFHSEERAFEYILSHNDCGEYHTVKKLYILDTCGDNSKCIATFPAP